MSAKRVKQAQCLKLGLVVSLLTLGCGTAEEERPKTGPAVEREVSLDPDLFSDKCAYTQIRESFGEESIEAPDLSEGNHQGFKHIRIRKDSVVGDCFDFYLHRDLDLDRSETWPIGKRRQRNEIKGYTGSNDGLKATKGQIVRYTWRFRISGSMSVSEYFCHFFQLKAVGGNDISMPLFTISGGKVGGNERLELRAHSTDEGPGERRRVYDWEACKNQWLEADCLVKFDDEGFLRIAINSVDGAMRFSTEFPKIDTWRHGSDFVRPKWGIYRSLEDKNSIKSQEDIVSFTSFRVQELSDLPRSDKGGQNAN
jgi:hypothetical protein